MNSAYRCGDTQVLVSYLYDGCDPTDRDEVERHLAGCASCAEEARALRAARGALQAWKSPEPSFGFRVVAAEASSEASARPRGRAAWTWAAAAVLALAAAGALANLEIRHGQDGWVVRMGWAGSGAVAPVSTDAPAAAWRADLARVEADLRREMDRLGGVRAAVAPEPANPAPEAGDPNDLLRRVRALIEESERRQQRVLALRLMQVNQEFQDQRLFDLATINQGFNQINQDFSQLDYLVRVSQR